MCIKSNTIKRFINTHKHVEKEKLPGELEKSSRKKSRVLYIFE